MSSRASAHPSQRSQIIHMAQLGIDEQTPRLTSPSLGMGSTRPWTESQAHSSMDGRKGGKPNPSPVSSQLRAGGAGAGASTLTSRHTLRWGGLVLTPTSAIMLPKHPLPSHPLGKCLFLPRINEFRKLQCYCKKDSSGNL